TVPTNLISGFVTNAPAPGTPIFVRLSRQGPFHRVESASMRPVEAKDGSPVLRGRISERSAWWPGRRGSTNVSVIVDYGLERYYVREGTGSPTGTLTVEATVATSGNGFIRQVFLDGKPYAEAMRGQAR
ncbi:MAG: hypothetical protein HYR88_10845, partial [Verrucomicrobia bacterium]|nr:hypothetical protein [Verrucomicrobiota bacterium]